MWSRVLRRSSGHALRYYHVLSSKQCSTKVLCRGCAVADIGQKHHKSNDNQSSYSNTFNGAPLKNILFGLGLGAGIATTIAIKSLLIDDTTEKTWSYFTIFPHVKAAFPFFPGEDANVSNTTNKDASPGDKKNSLRSKYNFIADVVEKVNDAVVSIHVKDRRWKDHLGNGSGCIVSSDGLILTNAHVVTNTPRSSTLVVQLQDGRQFHGVVEDIDAVSDLALVRIKCDDLPVMHLGTSSDLRPGEFVIALGSPFTLNNTITSGIVSSVGRSSKDLGLNMENLEYIQTDASIDFGNSGGPLVNLDGDVIGINSMKVTPGISFAIPADYVKKFLTIAKEKREKMEKYKSEYGADKKSGRMRYIGVTLLNLTKHDLAELQQRRGSTSPNTSKPTDITHGVIIWTVVVGSPAYHAGLQPQDIITHINGHDILSSREFYKISEGSGDMKMIIMRNGQRYAVTVAPEE